MHSLYKLFYRCYKFPVLRGAMFFLLFLCTGCNKLVSVEAPPIYTTVENAYASDGNAIAVLNGIYANMSVKSFTSGESINVFASYLGGLSSDEFTLYDGVANPTVEAYYRNSLNSYMGLNVWEPIYRSLYKINDALLGLTTATNLTPSVRMQLLGEAHFLRAFSYFYLVNYYGPVPLALTRSYDINALLPRSPEDEVYKQIVSDLMAADSLLLDHFVGKDGYSPSNERVVPNRWAAKAMLARVYLYRKEYDKAIAVSGEVIDHSSLFSLTALNDVFLMNSQEAIWQLQPVNIGWNTEDARTLILPETGPSDLFPVYLSDNLLNSFETGDQRRLQWVDSCIVNAVHYFFPYKYKSATLNAVVTEYHMVLRLAEQYLIRAEANAQISDLEGAIRDLNTIRRRAQLPDYNGEQTVAAVTKAIMHEKRIELFSEWGHRWLDLKRTKTVDAVMSAATAEKGGTWQSYQQYYPLPFGEIQTDPNLVQNSGY